MAHYCVFCDRSFISFTQLRSHQCQTIRQNQRSINPDLWEEKENWIELPFEEKFSPSETRNCRTYKTMEENYLDIKSDFEYTIELNAELDPDLRTHINPKLGKLPSNSNGSREINGVSKPTENEREGCSGAESDEIDNSDYVYVLEPDESINLQLGDENEPESRNTLNELKYGIGDNHVKCEVSDEVLDLSGSSKRKRKSNLASALSHIHKIKSVCVNQENSDCYEGDNENQANKVHIIEKKEITVDQSPTQKSILSNVINDESPKDLSMKSEVKSDHCAPMYSTPVLSTVNSGSLRKNRRKRSIPVRCEKIEEMCDITDIGEEYGVQSEFKSNVAIQDYAEKGVEFAPIDLAPNSYASTALSMEKTIERNLFAAPLDLTPSTTTTKVVETILKSPPTKLENVQPVDLSKPANQMLNGLKSEVVKGGLPPPMLPNAMPFNPVQMRQLFEHVYKMQAQFPNQNLVQTQLMQFHALMQNAMLNGGIMPGTNINGKKRASSVKSDKNDNVVKIEPATPNDPITNDFQKFNIDTIYNNGLLQNNFALPFNTFNPGSLPPTSPFTPSPNSQINRSVRKKNKEQSQITESSPDSPKTEGSLPLIALDCKYGPEQILDTLQKYFPVVPIENLPKAQISEDITGNPVKFFVKDNEQIRVIVDSLLLVGVLDLHEQQVHGTEPVYKYICRVCNQTFFHVEHLTKHIKKHHVIKKYQCSECDRSFHDAGNYRQHMRVHDEADVPYECPECNRRFRHKCTLKVHMRIHTGEKPFRCDVCDATFKISSGLQTHMRKHTGETPYACEFCDLRFKCQSNLKQHLFQHTQVRPFPCDKCGKTYSRKSIRDAHLLTHTKDMIKEHVKQWIDDLPEQPVGVAVGGSE